MTHSKLCRAALALAALGAPAGAQQFAHDIPLTGLGNGNPARPFGIAHEPAADLLYVPVAGTFTGPNDVVAVIDPATDQVIDTIQVEAYPQEVAFAHDGKGALLWGAVSNSSSGSLTIFDASRQVLGHVPLPDPFGLGTCYPFGVVWDAASARFLVSTVDGSGDVHAVDPVGLAVDPAAGVSTGFASGSRMAFHAGKLVVGASRYNAGFTNANASLARFDMAGGGSTETLLVPEERGSFPGVQDVQPLGDGRLVVGGLGFSGYLYWFDDTGLLQRTIFLPGASGAHGLAAGPGGELLAVCDLAGDALVLWDVTNMRELSTTALNTIGRGYSQPNDAVFTHGKLYVTAQGSEEVVVFDQLPDPTPGPGYAGTLTVSDSTPLPGDLLSATVTGSGTVALAFAREGESGPALGQVLEIGPGARLLGTGAGSFTATTTLPTRPELRGLHLWLQGAVRIDSVPELTAPRVVVVQ